MNNTALNLLLRIEEEEEDQPTVAYIRNEDGFVLYTISATAVRLLKKVRFDFDFHEQCFKANVKKLPAVTGVLFYEHQVKRPSEYHQGRLQSKYGKYLKMSAVRDKMTKAILQVEEELVAILLAHGLKLKPGSKDSQLLVPDKKTRLHYQQSMHRILDEDALSIMMKKYPALKKCLRVKKVVKLDRLMLEELLGTLPASVVKKIMFFDINYSFVETKLKRPGCKACGGKILKDGNCKRCGLAEK